MSSGLVSLNVHEPLTFDGTEIVLHPDLFSPSHHPADGAGNVSGCSSFSTATAAVVGGGGGPASVAAAAAARLASVGSKDSSRLVVPLAPAASAEEKLASIAENSKPSAGTPGMPPPIGPQRLINVGDMIEIKVWDPLPRHHGGKSNISSVMRRRSSPPTSNQTLLQNSTSSIQQLQQQQQQQQPHQQPSSSAQSSTSGSGGAQQNSGGGGPTTKETLQEAASTLGDDRNRTTTTPVPASPSTNLTTTNSMQYSEASTHHPIALNMTDDSGGGGSLLAAAAAAEDTNNNNNSNSTIDASSTVSSSAAAADDRTQSVHNEESSATTYPSPNTAKSPGQEDTFPAKTVITSSQHELPPVFPRSRTNTAEAPPPPPPPPAFTSTASTPTLPPKPPSMTQRGRTSSSAVSSPTAAEAVSKGQGGTTSRPVSTGGTLPKPRHFRDLSDMTIDTVYNSSTALLDGSHQLMDLNVPAMATGGTGGGGGGGVGIGTTSMNNSSDDLLEDDNTWAMTHISSTHSERLSIIMLVTEKSLTSLKSSARTQVSILRPVAELYDLSSYDMVTIRKIEKHEEKEALEMCSADFVLVTIKDQFISRGDMHYFQKSLLGSWIFEGQRLSEGSRGIQARARELRHKDRHAFSGIITEQTKITYRSRSARLIWLVQMSSEMWDYSSPYERNRDESLCETYFDKWIAFLHRLFVQWKELETTHSLTIVFFSRTFLGSSPPLLHLKQLASSFSSSVTSSGKKDVYGRSYEDHFRIVVENATSTNWDSLIVTLKEAFVKYPSEVGWNLCPGEEARRPSSASQGNVLEAINVTLNLLQFHYLDRDLHRTGNSIVLVSGGNGVFEVTKGLASITYERMMVNGIGSDMLSLGLPPLHTAPFFLYVSDLHAVEKEGVDFGGTYYEVPHWMHLSFVSYDTDSEVIGENAPSNENRRKVVCVTDIAGRPVFSNGFLTPGIINNNALTTSPSNIASAPPLKTRGGSVMNRERQMIAGRDFNDILEACRPRNAGVLPSALDALLRIYGNLHEKKQQVEPSEPPDQGEGDNPALPEWGAMACDSTVGSDSPIRHRRTVALGEEPAVDMAPALESTTSSPLRPKAVDEIDKSSVSSSYTSQYSVGLGVSYDRPFLASGASPTLTGIQVQKSPSMEIFLSDDDDDDATSDGVSTSSTGLDLGESSFESGSDAAKRRKRTSEKYMESLRKAMREFDSKSVVPAASPRLNPLPGEQLLGNNSEKSVSQAGGPPSAAMPQQIRPTKTRTGASKGGIGAALTQYRLASGSTPAGGGGGDAALSSFARVSSSTILSGLGGQRRPIPDVIGARGMSPLILPPVNVTSSELRRSSFDNRLVHPVNTDIAITHRPVLYEKTHGTTALTQRTSTLSTFSRSGSPILTSAILGSPQARSRLEARNSNKGASGEQRLSHGARSRSRSRRKKAFNPFRQQDEDEVLKKKSHNRRRWSHVFPVGEIEFKRHAGPNWKSLTVPAILPLSLDYFPSQQEIDHNYTFSIYNVTLSDFENSPYSSFSSNKDVLMEMVRQRLIQDFQVVPSSHVNVSNYRGESPVVPDRLVAQRGRGRLTSDSGTDESGPELIRRFLSMGHRLQVLTYDPSMDIIEVTRYDAKLTRAKSEINTFRYNYMCYCQETQQFTKAVQSFTKYAEPYNWNKVDRIVAGGEDRSLLEGMRFKRLMFGIIPPERFDNDTNKEQEYIAKFQRLLEYLNKLRDKGESPSSENTLESSSGPLDIKIVKTADKKDTDPAAPISSTPGISSRKSMVRFYVSLRKRSKQQHDIVEWMEVVVDATFDTSWSYRIMFHWLFASADRVEAQVQLLQRRCTQFGLDLVPFPSITVSKNCYLGPFKAPASFEMHDKDKVPALDQMLCGIDYVHDGVFFTDIRAILECIEDSEVYDFGNRWSSPPSGRQFVHRSGTLFARILTDRNGLAIIVVLGNYPYTNKDKKLRDIAASTFQELSDCIHKTIHCQTSTIKESDDVGTLVAPTSGGIVGTPPVGGDNEGEDGAETPAPTEKATSAAEAMPSKVVSTNDGNVTS